MSKKLSTVLVSPAHGIVGLTFIYVNAPADHLLLPVTLATQLKDRLEEACKIAVDNPGVPGDRVGVSDAVSVGITPPSMKGH